MAKKWGKVPTKLKGFKIYELDLGGLIAGAQFRGDFEKRLKNVMEGIRNEGHAIIYIDEIHNLVGAGQTGEGAMDATQMLRPYMEMAGIRVWLPTATAIAMMRHDSN